ncbi:hypothetical protein M106_3803 [Bacteroides fragilis str. 1009-4-F |jgi:hypothetical protein|nr:hypothetical protein M106_3803 [Bacteroides fragilis str. 1009-4-F \
MANARQLSKDRIPCDFREKGVVRRKNRNSNFFIASYTL